jgi:hypothetical protein
MPWDLFLSHRSTERAQARQLQALLTSRGLRVWLDAERVDDFTPDLGGAISHGLASCRALLALATPAWSRSPPNHLTPQAPEHTPASPRTPRR